MNQNFRNIFITLSLHKLDIIRSSLRGVAEAIHTNTNRLPRSFQSLATTIRINGFLMVSLLCICSCEHFEEDKKAAVKQVKVDAKTVKDKASDSGMRVANNVRDGIKRTNNRIRDWWLTPLPNPQKKEVPTRYCYKVLQDILCYREQMAGWEDKLVGYQGTNAMPPAFATTKPLPQQEAPVSSLAETRIKTAKPVFIGIPPEIKEVPSEVVNSLDAEQEALPTSPLAPQL